MDCPDKQNQNRQQEIIAKLAEDFIKALKEDKLPWSKGFDPELQAPRNPATGTIFSGSTKIILLFTSAMMGYKDPRWMTIRQAYKLAGVFPRIGEFPATCVRIACFENARKNNFHKIKFGEPESTMKDGKPVEKKFARISYFLYNAEQFDGLSLPPLQMPEPHKWDPNERAETLISNSKAKIIEYNEFSVFSSPDFTPCYCCDKYSVFDEIRMPKRERFHDAGKYYGTLLHELSHWTGHPSRLGRFKFDENDRLGEEEYAREEYAREELRAEIASSLLCSIIGVPNDLRNQKAYVQRWSKMLHKNPQEILYAASAADKIVTYLRQFDPVKDQLLTRSRKSH